MAKQVINVGSSANDGTGDKIRVAFQKTNANFTELYDTKVESIVAGTNITVDNTDPLNPVVSSSGGSGGSNLGLIRIEDINGELFTDLATAGTYIRTFTSATITDESFNNGVYYFTVPSGSDFNLINGFLADSSASLKDEFGFITLFDDTAFSNNSGNNILGNVIFGYNAFASSSGNNILGNCTFSENGFNNSSGNNTFKNILLLTDIFAQNSSGTFIINGNIGTDETANYPNFFVGSTATIWAKKEKRTSNAGGLEGDLATAQANGCGLFFYDMAISQDGVWLYDAVSGGNGKIKLTDNELTFKNRDGNLLALLGLGYLGIKNADSGKSMSISTDLLTDNQTYQLPDQSGTIALTSDITIQTLQDVATVSNIMQNDGDDYIIFKNGVGEQNGSITNGGDVIFRSNNTNYRDGGIETNSNSLSFPDKSGTIALTSDITPSVTNLSYTPSPTNGIVNSDTGTDATIPLADITNAGLLSPSEKAIIAYINKTSVKLAENITKGQAVYVSSANGTNIIVSKASNASEDTSSKVLGLLETTGVTNDIVNIITFELLGGLDTSTATVGDKVWLGTNGNLIYGLASKPVAPAHLVYIGVVTRVSATVGEIFINIQNGFELKEIHDVLITTPTNEDFLQYESSTSLWKNIQITASWLRSKLDSIYLNKSGDTIIGDIGNTSTGFFRVANGTTAQRPVTPLDGMVRYNSTTLRNEFYSNGSWRNMARLEGDNFTGTISATNLSGTNTGDQDLSSYSKIIYKDVVPSSAVTGTTVETLTGTYKIPANTFSASDIFNLLVRFERTVFVGSGLLRVRIGTTSSFSTSLPLIAYLNSVNQFNTLERDFKLYGGNLEGFNSGVSAPTDRISSTSAKTNTTFNPTLDNWIFISLNNSVSSDSSFQSFVKIIK